MSIIEKKRPQKQVILYSSDVFLADSGDFADSSNFLVIASNLVKRYQL